MERYTLFTNRDILRLLVPLFIEQLLFMLVGTADTLMVASLGEASISAVSLADMFNNLIASIFFALATGGAVVVSQCIGAKNLVRARENTKQLIVLLLITGLLVSVPTELFLPQIIRFFYGALADDVYTATKCYLRITLASLPLIALYGGGTALFRCMNRTRTTMVIALIANLLNILGNAILIFGCHLGVAGAAYATFFSRFFSMAAILWLLTDRSKTLFLDFRNGFRLSWALLRKILAIGIPGGIENGMFQFGRVIVLGLIAAYGTREIAANAVANVVDYFGCVCGHACCLGVVTVIGQAVGAGDAGQVRYYAKKMMRWAYATHALWNILLFCFLPLILPFFHNIDAATMRVALILILIHNGIGIFLWPLSFVFPNILRSMNDVRWPMAISIGSMILFRVGGSYLLARFLHSGVVAVWCAMILDWIVRSSGFLFRYHSGAWLRLSHFRDER